MRKIKLSGRFKRDLKRYKYQKSKIRALGEIIRHLEKDGRVPIENIPHKLHGIYEGCMECHVEDDFLLIKRAVDLLGKNENQSQNGEICKVLVKVKNRLNAILNFV